MNSVLVNFVTLNNRNLVESTISDDQVCGTAGIRKVVLQLLINLIG